MSTNFAKTLVWKQDYDIILWRHKQRTPNTNDYPMPLNELPPMKIFSAYATVGKCTTRGTCRKFRKWLVFNHKYAGSVNTCERVKNIRNLKAFLSICLCTILSYTGLNLPSWNFSTLRYCWTVQIAQTFKLIIEILTQRIGPRQTACSSTTFWLFLFGAKWITII